MYFICRRSLYVSVTTAAGAGSTADSLAHDLDAGGRQARKRLDRRVSCNYAGAGRPVFCDVRPDRGDGPDLRSTVGGSAKKTGIGRLGTAGWKSCDSERRRINEKTRLPG